jgi:hypothetical protein
MEDDLEIVGVGHAAVVHHPPVLDVEDGHDTGQLDHSIDGVPD